MSAAFLDLAQVVSLISFGALVAFTAVNFSVFMQFYIKSSNAQDSRISSSTRFYHLFQSVPSCASGSIWIIPP